MADTKIIQIEVPEELHRDFKLHCKIEFDSIKGRVIKLIKKDTKENLLQ